MKPQDLINKLNEKVPSNGDTRLLKADVISDLEQMNLIEEGTVWNALKWLKSNHYFAQTESKLQEITKELTEYLNHPF